MEPLRSLPKWIRERTNVLNQMSVQKDTADFVLVWLQQTLRGHDHPSIEAGLFLARELDLPILVYHGLRCDYPYASHRLSRFILGASREMGLELRRRNIHCIQLIQRDTEHGKGMVYRLAERAACVITDDHPTFVASAQAKAFASNVNVSCLSVDSTLLVPHRCLPDDLGSTAAFRTAHTPKRETAMDVGVEENVSSVRKSIDRLPDELMELAQLSERDLDTLVETLPIDQKLRYGTEFEASASAAQARLLAIDENFVRSYPSQRNNASFKFGATGLSPYLHFGMVAPWHVVSQVRSSGAPKSSAYKLLDELLTWREWSHYRLRQNSALMRYETLPQKARASLSEHASDRRQPELSIGDVLHGRTPDQLFNAAARSWLHTGWLHNNLRMYWAKQLLRFMPTPQGAWAAGCYINDRVSYDGRDPATYISMRWAFGEAKPGYRNLPIYGFVAPKSSVPIMKRDGMSQWTHDWSRQETVQLDCANFAERAAMYGVAPEEIWR